MDSVSDNPEIDFDVRETMEKFWEGFVAWGISGGVNVTEPPQPTNPPDVVVSGSDPWYEYDPNPSPATVSTRRLTPNSAHQGRGRAAELSRALAFSDGAK